MENNGRVADFDAFEHHIQLIFVAGAGEVLNTGFFNVQITPPLVHGFFIGDGHGAPVVADGGVKVHQIVGVEHYFLQINLRPAYAQAGAEAEVLSSGLLIHITILANVWF
jgi:hypothetical protein